MDEAPKLFTAPISTLCKLLQLPVGVSIRTVQHDVRFDQIVALLHDPDNLVDDNMRLVVGEGWIPAPPLKGRVATRPTDGSDEKELSGHELLQTTDARVWAKEFVRRFGGDESLMISWFANAIMAGHDHAKRETAGGS